MAEIYHILTAQGVKSVLQMTNRIFRMLNDAAASRETRESEMDKKIKAMESIIEDLEKQNALQGSSGGTPGTQTASSTPPPQHPLLQQPQQPLWYPSAAGSWGQPQFIGYAPTGYPPVYPPGYPPGYPPAHHYHPVQPQPSDPIVLADRLLRIIGTLAPEATGITEILGSADAIGFEQRSRANQILRTEEFHAWATSLDSRELLVQGDPAEDVTQAGPALSLLSATITQALQNQERFVPLVFFCVQQAQSDDALPGPVAMIRSLTVQLIQQYYTNTTFPERYIDIQGLQRGDIDAFCSLFKFLVRQVARKKTISCVIDGVGEYENDENEAGLRKVLDCILDLVRAEDVPPAVKVLVTCHTGTVEVHKAFKDDAESFLSLEGLISNGDEGAVMDIEDELQ
ncbi:hypothetical protein ONZ43_g4899 [Nemania bipapillata]|uniref:Uncharacterized protein n=1 Tax=Nemania bipapillata TaxID=110536 RepID=A0ACC2IH05_9PEZI|nr:hypothetical protein ONZ43_g4899 [Nemania bipapillata]